MTVRILIGDCRDMLRTLPDESVHCVVTSPPYFGLRDYGIAGQIGLESSPNAYVAEMMTVFREVRRVLRLDGTLWLNLGDSYATGAGSGRSMGGNVFGKQNQIIDQGDPICQPNRMPLPGLKSKDLIGIPWRVAFALQTDGWWLRQDIIWAKPNPMPESVTDRCTKAHEYLFLLSKNERYFYDAEALKTKSDYAGAIAGRGPHSLSRRSADGLGINRSGNAVEGGFCISPEMANKRSVWEVPTMAFPEAHFATFPSALVEPCIKAGTSEKGCCAKCGAPWIRDMERTVIWPEKRNGKLDNNDRYDKGKACNAERSSITKDWKSSCSCNAAPIACIVLDPFAGAGTVGLVADRLQRSAVLIELNPQYAAMARRRIANDAPLLALMGDKSLQRVGTLSWHTEPAQFELLKDEFNLVDEK
jgi:DNA modification methylase